MYVRPSTDQIIEGACRELDEQVLPLLAAGSPASVLVQQMVQLLRGCAVRAAHEIAWMHEETAAIVEAVAGIDDDATAAALAAYHAAPAGGLHLDEVAHRYDLASQALGAAVEAAYRTGDVAQQEALRALLRARSANEMAVVGALELVGRG
ncbi:MAG: hypothetical protein ACKO91_14730 [Acidimicrobiales bacterium]